MDPQYTTRFLDTLQESSPDAGTSGNRGTLHKVYDAIIRGDFDEFGDLLTEDVELDIRGLASMDGNWRGRKAVVEAARMNFAQVAEQKPEIESLIAQDDSIAVLFRESGVFKLDGRGYRLRVVQWFTFANGKIKKIDEIAANAPASGSPPE